MGIIGGADGPTAVVVSKSFVLCAAMLAAILAAGVILWILVKRKRNK